MKEIVFEVVQEADGGLRPKHSARASSRKPTIGSTPRER